MTSHCWHKSSPGSGFGLGPATLWEGVAAEKDFFSSCLCGMRDPDDLSHACLPLRLHLSICEHQALHHSLSRAKSSVLLCLSIEAVEGFRRASLPPTKQGQLLGTSVLLVGEQAGLHKQHETQPAWQAPRMHPNPQDGGHVDPSLQGDRRCRIPGSCMPHLGSHRPVTPSTHLPRGPSVPCPGSAADIPGEHGCPPSPCSQPAPLRLLLPPLHFHLLLAPPGRPRHLGGSPQDERLPLHLPWDSCHTTRR